MRFFRWFLSLNRSFLIAFSFVILIGIGTVLLMLPQVTTSGKSLNPIDALFMATSASTVTGFAVINISTELNRLGQVIILILYLIGAFGLMTITTIIGLGFGNSMDMRTKLLLKETLNQNEASDVGRILKQIVIYSFGISTFGGAALTCILFDEYGLRSFYIGFWHAISAFCNSGFDVLTTEAGMRGYATNLEVNLILIVLISLGGLGFAVIGDIANKKSWKKLMLHTKLVIATNAILYVGGAILFFALEYSNTGTIGQFALNDKILVSCFQSVTTHSAGFATIDLTKMRDATFILFYIMMFIGASPASCGGGFKTTTFAVLVLNSFSQIRGKKEVTAFGRRIDQETISRASSIFWLSILWIVFALFLIMALDELDNGQTHAFQLIVFEVIAAFSTVGCGLGITPDWNIYCKLVLIATMYMGRISMLTFGMSFVTHKVDKVRYPIEKIIIG
ncbi:MAG: potassium transporter TrkG [Phascolarctobacterium sp.]|nr:potassium transporter TrkG [Phascolarctobacterium sp.]